MIAEHLEACLGAAVEAGGLVAGIVVADEAFCHLAAVRRPIHPSSC